MIGRVWWLALLGSVVLGGCALSPRRPPPPNLVNDAAPAGFSSGIRLVSVDRAGFARELPQILGGLRRAAGGAPISILALSGGGANAAFGAGALAGLAQAHARPQFTAVTGVSAGALIAPFAFLGPDWDAALQRDFTSGSIKHLERAVSKVSITKKILFPTVAGKRDPLVQLVDRTYTDAMIDAIGREATTGRKLIVATTDLDSQETTLWDMTAIATHGGAVAHDLFRKVLTASASVPGIFPPVLIRVHEGDSIFDEMHVDGSVTTPLFILPLIAPTVVHDSPELSGGTIYVIVDGKLGKRPTETRVNTFTELIDSFSAQITYKTREALTMTLALARRQHMHLLLSSIPIGYPTGSFLDFHRAHLRQLFSYGERCAARGLLWTSFTGSVERNLYWGNEAALPPTVCPASAMPTASAGE